ncbi:uncharacterized protein LOC117328736 [Pecten maximus]|uniref:uncharacterized protein LOC117328736 n=1 Tax=Pecten maximus TaxID=6579 RepID=UPI00145866DE|nr:uncharacterized protein LOC117328736 [Pecten maximus]
MGLFLRALIIASLVSLSVQSDVKFRTKSLPKGYISLESTTDTCYVMFNNETLERVRRLKQELEQGKFDVLVVQIHLNETKNVSDIVLTMSNSDGLSLSKDRNLVMTSYLQKSTKIEHIQTNMTCIPRIDQAINGVAKGVAFDFAGNLFDVLGGISENSEQACNGTGNCTKTCGKAVDEPFLVNLTYIWVVIILLYSPNLVYVFYDALHIKDDNLTRYHKKDWPYSVKRFVLKVSYYMVTFCPLFTKYLNRRPVTRSLLLMWMVGILVQILNVRLQMSELSSKLAYKELDVWMYDSLSREMRYQIYGAIVVVGMIITLILLHVIPTATFKHLLDDPHIFMLSSIGTSKTLFVKKSKLKDFLKHEEKRKLTDGHTMIAMHAERFMIIFNTRFWFLLIKESFSGLIYRNRRISWNCITFVPVFVLCLLFFTLNIAVNILWGFLPLLGLFFSCLTLVNSWLELFRVCFLAVYFTFFVIIIFGNNLVFVFNIIIYTTLYTIPCSSFDDLSQYFMVFPVLLYLCFYWRSFTGLYRTMLEYMFKLKLDADSDKDIDHKRIHKIHQGRSASNEKLTKSEVAQTISIKEFDFVCNECSPVRKKVLKLLIKIMMTGIFMLLTLTVLFLRSEIDTFSKAAKTVAFIVIVLLPRVIEKLWSDDEATKQEELEEKISEAVCRWRFETCVDEEDRCAIEVENVNCTWWNVCKEDREISDRIHNREQMYGLNEGSVTMLNTKTESQNI